LLAHISVGISVSILQHLLLFERILPARWLVFLLPDIWPVSRLTSAAVEALPKPLQPAPDDPPPMLRTAHRAAPLMASNKRPFRDLLCISALLPCGGTYVYMFLCCVGATRAKPDNHLI